MSVTLGKGNGLSPIQHLAITWNGTDLLPIKHPGKYIQWNFNQNTTIFNQENEFKNLQNFPH